MTPRLSKLLSEFRVEIVGNTGTRKGRQTCAGRTLGRMVQIYGYAHTRLVVMSIVETKNNQRMLMAPVMLGISDVLRLYPDWFGDKWLRALDEIDLGALHAKAKEIRKVVQPRNAIAMMLLERMWSVFIEQPLSKKG